MGPKTPDEVRTILLVDDEEPFLLSLSDGLTAEDPRLRALLAANGREALEALRTRRVDLVVTDLRMPEMDGYQLLSEMRRSFRTTPTIVLTALGSDSVRRRLRPLQPAAFVDKPVDLKGLVLEIRKALDDGVFQS